jgi:hypothetical protein
MTDEQALELLKLLYLYVRTYEPDIPQTISALAEDLAAAQEDSSGAKLLYEQIRARTSVS